MYKNIFSFKLGSIKRRSKDLFLDFYGKYYSRYNISYYLRVFNIIEDTGY